jgi:hypothetical protein
VRTRWALALGPLLLAATAGGAPPLDRPGLLRAVAEAVGPLLDAPAGTPAAPPRWPAELAELLQRLAPPEPTDYYWAEAEAVVEEALAVHRPDLLAPWREWSGRRRTAATRALLAAFREALERYALDHGAYPPAAPGLPALLQATARGGPYLGIGLAREDGWGHPLVYRPRDGGYDLLAPGPDGVAGSPDDVR